MAVNFEGETLDLDEVRKQLQVSVGQGPGQTHPGSEADTQIEVRPRIQRNEYEQLLDSDESDVTLPHGAVLREDDVRSAIIVGGEPRNEHLDMGITVAEEIMTMRGLSAAVVRSDIAQDPYHYLVVA